VRSLPLSKSIVSSILVEEQQHVNESTNSSSLNSLSARDAGKPSTDKGAASAVPNKASIAASSGASLPILEELAVALFHQVLLIISEFGATGALLYRHSEGNSPVTEGGGPALQVSASAPVQKPSERSLSPRRNDLGSNPRAQRLSANASIYATQWLTDLW
jgi:hypothetical protein